MLVAKDSYCYSRIKTKFFIHQLRNFLTVFFQCVKGVLYCLVNCLFNFFTDFFYLIGTFSWLQKN